MPDWSAIGRSSRRRGHSFERLMAKKLTHLLSSTDTTTPFRFLRTPCSGGHGIPGDLYEDPLYKTDWSNITIYCRTQVTISLEAMLCDQKSLPIRWIEETGINTIWLLRNRPGRVFVLLHQTRLVNLPQAYARLACGDWVLFGLENIRHARLNLNKIVDRIANP